MLSDEMSGEEAKQCQSKTQEQKMFTCVQSVVLVCVCVCVCVCFEEEEGGREREIGNDR